MENRFVKNTNKTILDKKTNLEWKSNWEKIERANFNEIKSQIIKDSSKWHIPSVEEFKSLSKKMDKLPSARYLKKVGFNGVKLMPYWTSDSTNSFLGNYWICFDFYFFSYKDFKGKNEMIKNQVTLVRKIK